jgi:hypothetical protein
MLVQKLDYVHLNPIQPHWLLSNHPAEYRFSSASFYEQQVDEFGILTHFKEDSNLKSCSVRTDHGSRKFNLYRAVKWLKNVYKTQPKLFAHWAIARP